MDIASLDGMKRAQLQKLAKEAGIKANKKTEYLIAELKKYYSKAENGIVSSVEEVSGKSEPDTTTSSQTEATECETSAESEMESKPKAARGRRGRKAATRKQASRQTTTKADTSVSTESEADEVSVASAEIQEAHEADTESPPPPKKKTKRGRRGRKRAASKSPAKEPTPAKVQKNGKVPTSAKPVTPVQETKATTTPAKPEAPVLAITPAQMKHITTSRGSTSRRSVKKPTTPAADKKPAPSEVKATPEVTTTEASKPTTRSSSGRKAKKERRSTFEIDPVTGTPKTSITEKKEEVKPEKEVKFEVAHKKVAEHKPKPSTTRIPKLKSTKPISKPLIPSSTKNWAKIHAARMEKMESIDDFLERKRKRTENLCASVKRAKIVAEEAKATMESLKSHRTPQSVKGKMGPKIVKPVSRPAVNFMSPRPTSKPSQKAGGKPVGPLRTPAAVVAKTPGTASKSVSFKVKTPQQATGDAKNRCQKRIFTPAASKSAARKSVGNTVEKRKSLTASTRKSVGENRKSMGDARKSIGNGTTPFKLGSTQNTAKTPVKKPTFDIKASLSKGLTYKPYTGKLKTLGEQNIYNFAQPKSKPGAPNAIKVQLKMHGSNMNKAKAELKKPKIMSREERRAVAMKHRVGKRDNNMMARRGIKS